MGIDAVVMMVVMKFDVVYEREKRGIGWGIKRCGVKSGAEAQSRGD